MLCQLCCPDLFWWWSNGLSLITVLSKIIIPFAQALAVIILKKVRIGLFVSQFFWCRINLWSLHFSVNQKIIENWSEYWTKLVFFSLLINLHIFLLIICQCLLFFGIEQSLTTTIKHVDQKINKSSELS